ncbi:MAG: hypothetical protein HY907_08645 [Deltaproteobacteria bacterium]|nr:hypothetical protein [Deltaproteobacteria bacterium]
MSVFRSGAVCGLLALASAAAGCSEEVVGVRLIIRSDLTVPDELDRVLVTVAAARPDGGEAPMCEPAGVEPLVALPGAPSFLPYEILVERGERYDFWVAFRVQGYFGGALLHERQQLVRWPEEGVTDVVVSVEKACRDRATRCRSDTEECLGGECVGLQSYELFTSPGFVEAGAPSCFAVIE